MATVLSELHSVDLRICVDMRYTTQPFNEWLADVFLPNVVEGWMLHDDEVDVVLAVCQQALIYMHTHPGG